MASSGIGFMLLTLCMIIFGGVCGLLAVLVTFIRHPLTAFKKTHRDVPPKCLLDSSLGTHEYVRANGIKFHCVCAGDKSKPLMLFLHGFPEFWFSWRHQLREFSKDYRVVAIDMRGYGETDRPPHKLDYVMSNLVQDIVELIPALGYSQCTLVSHDWGGAVAWCVVSSHPELIERFIVINCPHPKVLMKEWNNWKQLFLSWYIFMFQIPKLPELIISMRDYDAFRQMRLVYKNKDSITPEVVEAYKYVYSQPGALTAGINYYRCLLNSKSSDTKKSPQKIKIPSLIIWGDDDTTMHKSMADMHQTVCENVNVKHIPNCSHFAQSDAPGTVNQHMREFLA